MAVCQSAKVGGFHAFDESGVPVSRPAIVMHEPEACASALYLIVRVEVHISSAPRLRATQGKRRRSCISESEMLR